MQSIFENAIFLRKSIDISQSHPLFDFMKFLNKMKHRLKTVIVW